MFPVFFFALGQRGLYAQGKDSSKSIVQEILSHPETDVAVLAKSRAVLLEAVRAKDVAKEKSVIENMHQRFDTSKIVILYPYEEILFSFWIADYERIFFFVKDPYFGIEQSQDKMLPQQDFLYSE
jgi:hypothetical protein